MVSFKKIRNGALSVLAAQKKNRLASALLLAAAGLFYCVDVFRLSGLPYYLNIWLFLYAAALLCLFNTCMNVFIDTHDTPSADAQMSAPLTDAEQYFSRLLAIAYIWILPFVISAVCIILSVFTAASDSAADYHLNLLIGYVDTALCMIAVTVICQCCTAPKDNSYNMSVFLISAMLAVLPITLHASSAVRFFNGTGFNENDLNPFFNPMLFSLFNEHVSGEDHILLAAKALVCLAVTGCGVFIYKKRSIPTVFTVFFETVMGLALLLIFTVSHMDESFGFKSMFFPWLGSIILRAVASRGRFSPKAFFRWTGMYLVNYGVFLLIMFIAFKTNCFGYVSNYPDISELTSNSIHEITVTIETPEDGRTGYDRSDEEYTKTASADNRYDILAFMKLTSSRAKIQSSLNKVYFRGMFGNKLFADEIRSECCNVKVYFWPEMSEYTHSRKYSVSFCMPRSEKEDFIREFEEFDGFEFMEAYQNVHYG